MACLGPDQHFCGQKVLPSKQKPKVAVVVPPAWHQWTLHHFDSLQGPVQSWPAGFGAAAAFFFCAKDVVIEPAKASDAMAAISAPFEINFNIGLNPLRIGKVKIA